MPDVKRWTGGRWTGGQVSMVQRAGSTEADNV
jgi:hypothetical protein